ncbi:MAG: type II toxin-antitoxin system prevent-host-death family antitoxin [Anaerolineae bacterium]
MEGKVTATELRLKTRDLMERVKFHGEQLIVENFGRPMVVMISFDDYMRIRDQLNGNGQPRIPVQEGQAHEI